VKLEIDVPMTTAEISCVSRELTARELRELQSKIPSVPVFVFVQKWTDGIFETHHPIAPDRAIEATFNFRRKRAFRLPLPQSPAKAGSAF